MAAIAVEVEYWQSRRGGGGVAVLAALEPVARKLESLRLGLAPLPSVLELVGEAEVAMDDVWHGMGAGAQARITPLLLDVGDALARGLAVLAARLHERGDAASSHALWSSPPGAAFAWLEDAIRACSDWQAALMRLTRDVWRHGKAGDGGWAGPPVTDAVLDAVVRRLAQVRDIRAAALEFSALVPSRGAPLSAALAALARLDPFEPGGPAGLRAWDAAVEGMEGALAPLEADAGAALADSLGKCGSQAAHIASLLRSSHLLLCRPRVMASPALARQVALSLATVGAAVGDLDAGADRWMGSAATRAGTPPDPAAFAEAVLWAQGVAAQVASLAEVVKEVAGAAGGAKAAAEARSACEDAVSTLGRRQREAFTAWCRAVETGLASTDLKFDPNGPLLAFDEAGNVRVRYGEGLVAVIRDARRLSALGFALPPTVQTAVSEGSRHLSLASRLARLAAFYNTLGSEIILSTKPMLLGPLLAFEAAVQAGGGAAGEKGARGGAGAGVGSVLWSDPRGAVTFVESLQAKADALGDANGQLRTLHGRVLDRLAVIKATDPLRGRTAWLAAIGGLREVTEGAVTAYGKEACGSWLVALDALLLAAVESGWRAGLEHLSEMLPEMRADLVLSGSPTAAPAFRPTLEELRATYGKESSRFIALPSTLAPLSSSPAALAALRELPARAEGAITKVLAGAETLEGRLAKLRDSFKSWASLASRAADAEAWVEANLKDTAAFEAGFASLRTRRKELERLPDSARVDCVTVVTGPFKVAVDRALDALYKACVAGMRRNLNSGLSALEGFLDSAGESLRSRPDTVEGIGRATEAWKSVKAERAGLAGVRPLEEARRALAGADAALDLDKEGLRLTEASARLDVLDTSLETFAAILEEARGALKGRLGSEAAEVSSRIDKAASRWAGLRSTATEPSSWGAAETGRAQVLVAEWTATAAALKDAAASLSLSAAGFGLPPFPFPALAPLLADIAAVEEAWADYGAYAAERTAMGAHDWLSFRPRLYDLADWAGKWAASPAVTNGRAGGVPAVAHHIADACEAVKRALPSLKFARGEPFREEHWVAMFKRLGLPRGTRLESLTVADFLEPLVLVALPEALPFLKDLVARAQGEVTLREALMELRGWADSAEFKLQKHVSGVDGRATSLIKEWREMGAELGDHRALLLSMRDSPYYRPFADTAGLYESKLAIVEEAASLLAGIQRRWVYLEPVLRRGALAAETPRFRRVDDEFRALLAGVEADARMLGLADAALHPALLERLGVMADQLERCQRALTTFLEAKRAACPRFYFLGDDDLLEILGQSHNPSVVTTHMRKLFQGVASVAFGGKPGAVMIVSMASAAGEVVPLAAAVPVSDDVTGWVNAFAVEMARTLATLTTTACADERAAGPVGSAGWAARIGKYPSQVLCLAQAVSFSRDAEAALKVGGGTALETLKKGLAADLAAATGKAWGASEGLSGTKTRALILDAIHHLDVLEQLSSKDAKDAASWAWQKQLRVTLSEKGRVEVRMVDAVLDYTYEYQGNAPKLVHTPLTDKCYLTLTQGLELGFGGNPYGPAGTGKTESVKALGSAVGRQVLVFNCDEGIDFASMGRMLTGIVRCGAWGCFDEFNRLREDQLSAVSSQIALIQATLKEKAPTVALLGDNVAVDPHAAIFVTLNPAGKGYGGRSRLPDNLKALFRPVAMSKPDNELIAETVLASEGFGPTSRTLGRRLVSLFTVASQLLSPQRHYDWGLRALKAVLTTGGVLMGAARAAGEGSPPSPATAMTLLIRAIRVNTLSKLTGLDAGRFNALLADTFPGSVPSDAVDPALEAAIRSVMTGGAAGVAWDAGQAAKIQQLSGSLDQRMGCVLVGPPGSGKTTLWRTLAAALAAMGTPVTIHALNPKAMPRSTLLGSLDADTREWRDGVLTAAARAVAREPPGVRSWIVLDGDVDPVWIEALNSVLDDNRLLTLPNGERISLASSVNFLFETHDLSFASPATVSRCGMLALSEADVDVPRLVAAWLAGQPEEVRSGPLPEWLQSLFGRGVEWVTSLPAPAWNISTLALVKSGLSHLASARTATDFAVGLIRGLGAVLEPGSRADFARDVLSWVKEPVPASAAPYDVWCPGDGGILSVYKMEAGRSGGGGTARLLAASAGWSKGSDEELLPLTRAEVQAGAPIATPTLQRTAAVLAPWVAAGSPVLLVGPPGAGKATLVDALTAGRRGTSVATLHCNASTGPAEIVARLRSCCALMTGGSGRVFRPLTGDRLVLLVKDVDLPAADAYGTVPLTAFLSQLLSFGGFWESESREFVGVEGVTIIATAAPRGTMGRNALHVRFSASLHVALVDTPTTAELTAIAAAYLTASFAPSLAPKEAATWGGLLAAVLDGLARTLPATPDGRRAYGWSPRDLSAWVAGLSRYPGAVLSPETVAHEAARRFRDRLAAPAHPSAVSQAATFDALLVAAFRSAWSGSPAPDLRDVVYAALGPAPRPGAVVSPEGSGQLSRLSRAEWATAAGRAITLYEREERELGLTLTEQAAETLAVVQGALARAGGHVVLIGRSGVGRRSAAAVAAHMRGAGWVTPAVGGPSYGLKAWQGEVKGAMLRAGVDGEEIVLFCEDHQLGLGGAGEGGEVLQLLNTLIVSGDVPGLFTAEESEAALSTLKEEWGAAQAAGGGGAGATLHSFFTSRVRSRLHVVVSLDPHGPSFEAHLAKHPALTSRASALWLGDWTAASRRAIATTALEAGPNPDATTGISHGDMVELLEAVHVASGSTPGPRDFAALLRAYTGVLASRRGGAAGEIKSLSAGLGRLSEAQSSIDELSKAAGDQRRTLREKQAAADSAMTRITEALTSAAGRRMEVETLSGAAARAEGDTLAKKTAIEGELAEITPILEAAQTAVSSIRKDNLDEIRALKMPPEPIADVLSAVLLMLGVDDTSWQSMKGFLGRRGVIQDILSYDAHRMSGEMRAEVAKVLRVKGDSFKHEVIYRASVAAAPLAAWVKAQLKYASVLEAIAPLEAGLAAAGAELARCSTSLSEARQEMSGIDARIATLKAEFASRTGEAEVLKAALARSEDVITRASALLAALSGEQGRWAKRVGELRAAAAAAPLQALLASAFITYAARTGEEGRLALASEWIRAAKALAEGRGRSSSSPLAVTLASLPHFDLTRVLSSEAESLAWRAQGLPGDALSTENAVVLTSCAPSGRAPLLIDPGAVATEWLARHLAGQASAGGEGKESGGKSSGSGSGSVPFEVVQAGEARFTTSVELAVRFGRTLLVRDVETIPALLVPLLRRDFTALGPRRVVLLGDKAVDCGEGCRILLATRNPSPALTPDMAGLLTLVSFAVTRGGLEGQLLGETLAVEAPELEARQRELLGKEEGLRASLGVLEEGLLSALGAAQGSLLNNPELLVSLAATKAQSEEIGAALSGSAAAGLELASQREGYRPFAAVGARLFFLLASLTPASPLYTYSLASFLRLVRVTLGEEGQGSTGGGVARVPALISGLETRVVSWTLRSLAKEDRLWFGLLAVRALRPRAFGAEGAGGADPAEWRLFLGETGGLGGEGAAALSGGLPLWTPPDRGSALASLAAAVPSLLPSLGLGGEGWAKWYASPTPERGLPAPKAGAPSPTPWQRVLLINALRPDRTPAALTDFVTTSLDVPSLAPAPASVAFEALAAEAGPGTPILLVTSPGGDPSAALAEYATGARDGMAPCHEGRAWTSLAMGGGVTAAAITALREAAAGGGWLYLANLHLVTAWLPTLDKELSSLSSSGRLHPSFRLWASAEPSTLPPALASGALKVAVEPPPGMGANLARTYAGWTEQYLRSGSPARTQVLALLAWFHAVVQERRAYAPQGWVTPYEFGPGDLRVGAGLVDGLMAGPRAGGRVPWAYLHGLLENAVYGGRVDSPADARVLRAALATVFHPDIITGKRPLARALPGPLPGTAVKGDYLSYFAALPPADAPSTVGLPDNADRAVARTASGRVVASLKALRASALEGGASSSGSGGPAGFDREAWAARLLPLVDSWEGRPAPPPVPQPRTMGGGGDVLLDFAAREGGVAEGACAVVSRDLASLRAVLSGSRLLTPAVARLAACLLADAVPLAWEEAWGGPDTAGEYLAGLTRRRVAIARWVGGSGRGAPSAGAALLSAPLSLSDMCRPSAFLVALRQATCRALAATAAADAPPVSMDSLRLVAAWGASPASLAAGTRIPLPATVSGLLLQGGVLDASGAGSLADAPPDAPELAPAPSVTLAWVPPDVADPLPPSSSVPLPLYEGLDRSTPLADLPVPCGDRGKWILSGAALFLAM
jgi:dynein heavy chain 2